MVHSQCSAQTFFPLVNERLAMTGSGKVEVLDERAQMVAKFILLSEICSSLRRHRQRFLYGTFEYFKQGNVM